MKFWTKLCLSTIIIISIILSFSRYFIVRRNFLSSLENSSNQNANKHHLERYYLEGNIISKIEQGEEVENASIVEYINSVYSYMNEDSEKVAIYTENKERIFCNFDQIDDLDLEKLFNKEIDQYYLKKIENKNYMVFSSYWSINSNNIYIVNIYDITPIYEERERQLKEVMFADIVIILIASIFISIFSKILTRPIEKLNDASKKISSGKFNERVNIQSNDEIGELANSFNVMAEEIENKINSLNLSIKQKDDFIAGFSHEIKTPMTAIIGYSDLLRLKKCDEDVTSKALNYIYSESKRLEELSYKLLFLMGLSENKIELKQVEIKNCIEKISRKIVLEDIKLKLNLEQALVNLDENLIEVVIRNLVQNASKAEPKDKCIFIQGELLEDKYRISVVDFGRGIPKEHIERVTEDFYMVDKSRSRENGGTGIGLSLCKKILNLHNSRIYIESEENIGTKVYFELEVTG